jgi:hypothetical protein
MPNYTLSGNTSVDDYYTKLSGSQAADLSNLQKNETKNGTLLKKESIQLNLLTDIQNKEKLLLTRSKMLQISSDRNSYKLKIIYGLLSVAIAFFILNILIYVFLSKKK